MTSADSNPVTGSSTPSSGGLKGLGLVAVAIFLVAILGAVWFDALTDPGFRSSAMEHRVRAGVPAGWTMKVTGVDEYSGPCIDGCEGSSLDVLLTAPEPRADRAGQQRELADAMRAGGWRYSAPLTRKQALAVYVRDYPNDLGDPPFDPDDETIGFDPADAGSFQGGPADTASRVSYDVDAQWIDGHLNLFLSAVPGD